MFLWACFQAILHACCTLLLLFTQFLNMPITVWSYIIVYTCVRAGDKNRTMQTMNLWWRCFFLKGGRIPIFSQTFPRRSVRKHPHTQEVMPVKAETVKCFSLRKRWTALCLHVGWGISDILRSYWDLVHKYWKISRQIGAPSTVIWMLFQRPYTVLHYYYSS